MEGKMGNKRKPTWKLMELSVPMRDGIRKIGLAEMLWGFDIFINGWPFLKLLLLGNVIVWLLMWRLLR